MRINRVFVLLFFISTCVSRVHAQVEKFNEEKVNAFNEIFFEATKKKLIENNEAAIELFEQSLNMAPTEAKAQVHHELSRLFHLTGSRDKAFYHGEASINLDPTNPWYYISLSETYRENYLYNSEAEVLMKLWPIMDYDLSIMLQTAQAYENGSEYKNCIGVLEEIEKRVGVDEDIIQMKARVYLKLNKPKKAEKELKKLSLIDSDLSNKIKLFRFYVGNGKEKKGIKYLQKEQKKYPESGQINLELAEYFRQKGDDKSFLKYLMQSLKSSDLDEQIRVDILRSLFQITQNYPEFLKDSYQILRKAEEYHPNNGEIQALFGQFLFRENRLEEANAKFLNSLKLNSSNKEDIYNQVLFTLIETGEYDKALEVAFEAIQDNEDNEVPYLFAGIVLGHQKKHIEAIEILLKVVDKPFINNDFKEQILINLAENYHRSEQYAKSDEFFNAVIQINPNNYLVLNNYAYYLSVRNEKLEQAEKMTLQVVDRFPDNPTYLDTYAWILYKKGNYSKALDIMNKVINLDSGSSEIWEHYGDILLKNGQTKEAIEAWNVSKKLGNKSEELIRKIDSYED